MILNKTLFNSITIIKVYYISRLTTNICILSNSLQLSHDIFSNNLHAFSWFFFTKHTSHDYYHFLLIYIIVQPCFQNMFDRAFTIVKLFDIMYLVCAISMRHLVKQFTSLILENILFVTGAWLLKHQNIIIIPLIWYEQHWNNKTPKIATMATNNTLMHCNLLSNSKLSKLEKVFWRHFEIVIVSSSNIFFEWN